MRVVLCMVAGFALSINLGCDADPSAPSAPLGPGNPPAIQGSADDPVVMVDSEDAEMEQAITQARQTVDVFIAGLANPQPGTGDYAVKAPISDSHGTEHFWLIDVQFADGVFTGTINNDPQMVENVTFGQSWTVAKEEISDWMFLADGKMHGCYTLRPLLKSMPPAEAAELRSRLAEP